MSAATLTASDLARQAKKYEAFVNWLGMAVNIKRRGCDRNNVGPSPQKWQ